MTRMLHGAARFLQQVRSAWPVRVVLLSAAIASYAVLSLEPFDWSPPRPVENGARWLDQSTLELAAQGGVAFGRTAPDWLATAVRNQEIEIDLRVRPATLRQSGDIFTIGRHGRRQNLAISQKGSRLRFEIRRTCTRLEWLELPCGTARSARHVFEAGRWTDLTLSVRPGRLQFIADGEVVAERRVSDTPLAVWDLGERVALGNDIQGGWPWLGEIGRAVVRTGGTEINLLDPALYEIPAAYWFFDHNPRLVPFRDAPIKDMARNAVMYVPFGALLALLGFWRRWSGAFAALLAAGAVSLSMETAQVFFSAREPSATDLVLNAAGGAFGFLLIYAISRDRRIARLGARLSRPRLRPRQQEG